MGKSPSCPWAGQRSQWEPCQWWIWTVLRHSYPTEIRLDSPTSCPALLSWVEKCCNLSERMRFSQLRPFPVKFNLKFDAKNFEILESWSPNRPIYPHTHLPPYPFCHQKRLPLKLLEEFKGETSHAFPEFDPGFQRHGNENIKRIGYLRTQTSAASDEEWRRILILAGIEGRKLP